MFVRVCVFCLRDNPSCLSCPRVPLPWSSTKGCTLVGRRSDSHQRQQRKEIKMVELITNMVLYFWGEMMK